MKKCSACKIELANSEYHRDKSKKDGLASTCKACNRAKLRAWRRGELTPRKSNQYSIEYRKEYLATLRCVPCADCNGIFPTVCMDFDHLPGSDKKFTIMTEYRTRSWDDVLQEIAKCEIVCSNCHRIRTLTRREVQS